MRTNEIKRNIKKKLSKKRYIHSLSVAKIALKIAKKNGIDKKKSYIAGLLHDIAREYTTKSLLEMAKNSNYKISPQEEENPILLHGYVGSIIANKDFGITDTEILNSIKYHTLGRKDMGEIVMIIYIADYIDPKRGFLEKKSIKKILSNKIEKMYDIVYDISDKYFNSGALQNEKK